jgi:8-oxo-dGTP diphosphatase
MIRVVAAVMQRGGRILIAQRKARDSHSLKWEFPGGKVENGESTEAALMRELREELGIQAIIGSEITRYVFTYPGRRPIELVFFQVSEFTGEPQNLVFEKIQWELPSRLPEYDFLEGDMDFVKRLAAVAP